MLRIFTQKPLSQTEAISKLAERTPIKAYTSQILALDAQEQTLPGHKLNLMA